jgi:uncharacterized protein (TIGR00661 family)
MQKLRFLFLVQGEGRGHMTQAIALSEYLRGAGHEIAEVMVGKSEFRQIPAFFYEKIEAPVATIDSPNFVRDKQNKGILIGKTIAYNLQLYKRYFAAIDKIAHAVERQKPHIIVNFYEFLCGLYYWKHKPNIPLVCVGHQYMLEHPTFEFPKGKWAEKIALSGNSNLASYGVTLKLALSFYPEKDIAAKKIKVIPPLLRKEIIGLQPEDHNFLMMYMLNAGYAKEVIEWHQKHPQQEMHVFWDNKEAAETYTPQPNLTFHRLNDVKFLEKLRTCSGYMSTAGFESICEAMYLGKPVFLKPTDNHFEQECNAVDATRAGAGITGNQFDINKFLAYIPTHKNNSQDFRKWVESAEQQFISTLEQLAAQK